MIKALNEVFLSHRNKSSKSMEMEKDLSLLYDNVILQHNREPFNFEKRQWAQHIVEAYNPLCGDKFKLFLDIEDGKIAKATFHGYGCAVSKAATSVLIKKIEGMSLEDVQLLLQSYLDGLNTEGDRNRRFDAELQAFEAVRQFPERMTCATLSWDATKAFFTKQ